MAQICISKIKKIVVLIYVTNPLLSPPLITFSPL